MTTLNTNNQAQAMLEGGKAFLDTISNAPVGITENQLKSEESLATQRKNRAVERAKRNRVNPEPSFLSAIRNWSRLQAYDLLMKKVAGKKIRNDFYQSFQLDLQQEIEDLSDEIQTSWQIEDEQRVAAKQQKEEQTFGMAHKYIVGLNDAILNGERQRQEIFNDGVQAALSWAVKYGDSIKEREKSLEEREKRISEREKEDYEYNRAMRALMKGDQKASFVSNVVDTGKNTLGCLFLWFLLVAGILVAIYFAFPAHH
jgi:hypothetical protein